MCGRGVGGGKDGWTVSLVCPSRLIWYGKNKCIVLWSDPSRRTTFPPSHLLVILSLSVRWFGVGTCAPIRIDRGPSRRLAGFVEGDDYFSTIFYCKLINMLWLSHRPSFYSVLPQPPLLPLLIFNLIEPEPESNQSSYLIRDQIHARERRGELSSRCVTNKQIANHLPYSKVARILYNNNQRRPFQFRNIVLLEWHRTSWVSVDKMDYKGQWINDWLMGSRGLTSGVFYLRSNSFHLNYYLLTIKSIVNKTTHSKLWIQRLPCLLSLLYKGIFRINRGTSIRIIFICTAYS